MGVIFNQVASSLDYEGILNEADKENLIPWLRDELARSWIDFYRSVMTTRKLRVVRIAFKTFEYIVDNWQELESNGEVPHSPTDESRLVVAFGTSNPQSEIRKRHDRRLRGYLGPTEKVYGKEWDKGHFIGHEIGGEIEQCEMNVFPQDRRFNRGWSDAGKRYRLMEGFCSANPGTLCFSRPIYYTGFARPCLIEFGLLRPNNTWWIEQFDNRPSGITT